MIHLPRSERLTPPSWPVVVSSDSVRTRTTCGVRRSGTANRGHARLMARCHSIHRKSTFKELAILFLRERGHKPNWSIYRTRQHSARLCHLHPSAAALGSCRIQPYDRYEGQQPRSSLQPRTIARDFTPEMTYGFFLEVSNALRALLHTVLQVAIVTIRNSIRSIASIRRPERSTSDFPQRIGTITMESTLLALSTLRDIRCTMLVSAIS